MSDGLDELLDTDNANANPGQGGGGKLRQQLETVLAQNAALQERLAAQEAAERQRSIDALFAKHQVPALARDLFPADAAPTDEAVTGLVEKYGSLWGAQSASATTPPPEQAATNAAQAFAANASPSPAAPQTEEQFRALFAEAKTPAELHRLMAQFDG